MTIQTIPGGLWIPNSAPFSASAPNFTSSAVMNAAASRVAFVFQVPKTGTLDWFELRQQFNSVAPTNGLRFSFQDLSATGRPDNTDDQYSIITSGFGAGAWLVPPSYMGSTGPGSGTKRSVTRGDWIACSIRLENFVAGNVQMAYLDFSARIGINYALNSYIATSADSGATYTLTATGGINLALKYDDGSYALIEAPNAAYSAFNTRTFNSGSTPDERGLLFQVPFPARLSGVWARLDTDAAFDIVLYDAASSVVVTNSIAFGNVYQTSAANGFYPFSSPISLTKNVNYRLTIKPGASNIAMYDGDFASSAIRAVMPGGSTWVSTQRTDAGAWTDTNTNLPILGLVFDGFDDATGGGSGGEFSAVF